MASPVTLPSPARYDGALWLVQVALCVWCVLSALEAIANRGAFRSGGVRGRDITALRRGRIAVLLASPLASPAGLATLPALRLAAGVALPFASHPAAVLLLLVAILVTGGLGAIVGGGSDGADKIATVAASAAALVAAGQLWSDPWLCLTGLVWASGQLTLAYATAGLAKLVRPFWRDGTAVAAAMTSYSSGHAWAAAVVRHPGRARVLAWAVVLPEALFPLALIAPPPACAVALVAFALFHVATAAFMGLNTYPPAFVACYPFFLMLNGILVTA